MATKPNDSPGSGLDKAPEKTFTEKLSDTVRAIVKPADKKSAQDPPAATDKDAEAGT
jgi:hypothetical protein